MINNLDELKERFDRIKDHKPKAIKKLNELGIILASAYKIDANLADEMWQYLVNLNVADNVGNAKFYIAQIFNKLTGMLSPEEAVELLILTPERMRLMLLYGYDGATQWNCLSTIIIGFLKFENVNNCMVALDYVFEKYGGLCSGNDLIFFAVAKSIEDVHKLSENEPQYKDIIIKFMYELLELKEDKINAYVRISMIIFGFTECIYSDELLDLANEYKFSYEFIELLWKFRFNISQEEFLSRWTLYLKEINNCNYKIIDSLHLRSPIYNRFLNKNNKNYSELPFPNFQEDMLYKEIESNTVDIYDGSKMQFFVSLIKNNDTILPYYFYESNSLAKSLVYCWIKECDWDRFTRYTSQALIYYSEKYPDSSLDSSDFWRLIKKFCDAYFYTYCDAYFYTYSLDSYDEYNRSYKIITPKNLEEFEISLSKISANLIGNQLHEEIHETIKDFIQHASGNIDVLQAVGFSDEIDNYNPIQQLKEYVHTFLQSGVGKHDINNSKYKRIWNAVCNNSLTEYTNKEELYYFCATDDELANFYFIYCHTNDYMGKMLMQCIKKKEFDRASQLVDMMISVEKTQIAASDWNAENILTIKNLIQYFIQEKSQDIYNTLEITNDMKQVLSQLVKRVLSSLPQEEQYQLIGDFTKITDKPLAENFINNYISQLLKDVEIYTTFPKPRGKGGAKIINQLSHNIITSFEILSSWGRLDIIAQIMEKFVTVKDILKPVTYNTFMNIMLRNIQKNHIGELYKNNPKIFEAWLETEENILKIKNVAINISTYHTEREFESFKNIVINKKGFIEEINIDIENIPIV